MNDLIERISNYLVDKVLFKDENPDTDEREVILFGVTRIVEDIPKYVAIFIISLILGILKDVGTVFLIVLLYKTFIGGAHARTNIGCFIITSIFFITPSFIARNIEITDKLFYIIFAIINIFSIYIILRYAPADTEEVPILNKNKRKTMQILAFISQILIDISLFYVIEDVNIKKIVLISLFYCDIVATNISYKLLRCTRSKDSKEFQDH